MNLNEFQKLSRRTKPKDIMPSSLMQNAALGIAGEAGEVADIIKKTMYQCHPLDKEKLVEELGDVLYYIAMMADVLCYGLDEIAEKNIEKLRRRYPDGFDPERSIHREV
ncbi:MAG: nucleoside triphosphate pyrophosphohydrolase family protein [Clostridia bacterium]